VIAGLPTIAEDAGVSLLRSRRLFLRSSGGGILTIIMSSDIERISEYCL